MFASVGNKKQISDINKCCGQTGGGAAVDCVESCCHLCLCVPASLQLPMTTPRSTRWGRASCPLSLWPQIRAASSASPRTRASSATTTPTRWDASFPKIPLCSNKNDQQCICWAPPHNVLYLIVCFYRLFTMKLCLSLDVLAGSQGTPHKNSSCVCCVSVPNRSCSSIGYHWSSVLSPAATPTQVTFSFINHTTRLTSVHL